VKKSKLFLILDAFIARLWISFTMVSYSSPFGEWRLASDCGLARIASEGYLVIILSTLVTTFGMALREHPFTTFNLLELS